MKGILLFVMMSFLTVSFCVHSKSNDDSKIPIISPSPDLLSRFELLRYLPKGGIVVEIGVERGDFSAAILKYTDPKKLYLIDCWEHQSEDIYPANANLSDAEHQRNLEYVKSRFKNDSRVEIIKAYSLEVSKLFEDKFFDWIYLDANHSYESIKKDLNAWYSKIKSGGLFVGHGYTSHLLYSSFGVVQALNEFMKMHKLEMMYLTNETFANWTIKIE